MKPHVQHGWGARIDKLIGLLPKVMGLTRIGKETICAERKLGYRNLLKGRNTQERNGERRVWRSFGK